MSAIFASRIGQIADLVPDGRYMFTAAPSAEQLGNQVGLNSFEKLEVMQLSRRKYVPCHPILRYPMVVFSSRTGLL